MTPRTPPINRLRTLSAESRRRALWLRRLRRRETAQNGKKYRSGSPNFENGPAACCKACTRRLPHEKTSGELRWRGQLKPSMPCKGRQKRRVASEGPGDGGKNYQALQPMQRILEHRFIDR